MILNLTQHIASPDQIEAGVIEPNDKLKVQMTLTFETIPTREEILERCDALVAIAQANGASEVMIGGAPYLMAPLEKALRFARIKPVYSYTDRVSVDILQEDGSTKVEKVFKHLGWVEAVSL